MIRVGRAWDKHDQRETFDALVIGSGMGGLTAAALLASHGGKRVAVLERHYMPGGFTHVFRRKGYEWDVGLHYVGGMERPQGQVRRLFDHVTGGATEWTSMGEVYDRVVMEDRVYDYRSGPDRFRQQMEQYFPGEAAAIARYLGLLKEVQRRSDLFFAEKVVPAPVAALFGSLMRAAFLRHAGRTTRETLQELTGNREMIGVLTAQWGDYGLPPGRSSFGIHALVAGHYLWGASYPVGGSSAIAAAMAPLIGEQGGRILYEAEVSEILVKRNRAAGVRMKDGSEIRAPLVVSDAGAMNTFLRLLPQRVAERHGLQSKMRSLGASSGHLCLYLGLRKSAEELGLPKHNLWLYPGPDHDSNVEAFAADPQAPLPVVYVSFPSAKDPTFEERYPGRATIELITVAPFERFSRWAATGWHKRGEEYEGLKRLYADRMLERLDGQLPGLREKIDYMEVSTPLSTRHFAGYQRGEIYGLEHSPERFRQRFLRPRTPVRGLYLTGQDAATAGIAGAMISGYLTASAVLGRNLLRAAGSGGG